MSLFERLLKISMRSHNVKNLSGWDCDSSARVLKQLLDRFAEWTAPFSRFLGVWQNQGQILWVEIFLRKIIVFMGISKRAYKTVCTVSFWRHFPKCNFFDFWPQRSIFRGFYVVDFSSSNFHIKNVCFRFFIYDQTLSLSFL